MSQRLGFLALAAMWSATAALAASSPPQPLDPATATGVLDEARGICDRDGAALWGRPLCGPMMLVDPTNLSVIANRADGDGVLKPSGAVFTGVLPRSVIVANTPTEWAGVRWTQIMWPLASDPAKRHVLIAHEMFHRVQPALGLTRPESGNAHLDSFDGRYLLQLEWRALAAALRRNTARARRSAIADALLFRSERYRLFQKAAAEEAGLEIAEGVAEYTGVRLGLETPKARTDYAVYDLSAFLSAPTFVRSFAYATGPAYGLLLDRVDPTWKAKLSSGQRLDQLLRAALRLPASAPSALAARERAYDDGRLRASETAREAARTARLAKLKARLFDGPVLLLPLAHSNYQFNPQTLQPLGDLGTVYPTIRLIDDWGSLEVEDGALLDTKTARVSAAGIGSSHLTGQGWRLTLKEGWSIAPAERVGDLSVQRTGAPSR